MLVGELEDDDDDISVCVSRTKFIWTVEQQKKVFLGIETL
jgi:hypothetical protein